RGSRVGDVMHRDEQSYWQRISNRRYRRRGFLAAGAGTAAALGLTLAGRGDDDEEPSSGNGNGNGGNNQQGATPGNSPAATQAPGVSGPPKKGGVWRAHMNGDPTNLDPMVGTALPTHQTAGFVYSHLYRFKAGPGV